jgi:hypothetical protein
MPPWQPHCEPAIVISFSLVNTSCIGQLQGPFITDSQVSLVYQAIDYILTTCAHLTEVAAAATVTATLARLVEV